MVLGIEDKELVGLAPPAIDSTLPVDGGDEDDGGRSADASKRPLPLPGCHEGRPGARSDCGGLAGLRDCCEVAVSQGGTFYLRTHTIDDLSVDDTSRPSTLAPFAMDVFEVTVGRFRAFVEAGQGTALHPPAEGVGAHPSEKASGWRSAFNSYLPRDGQELEEQLLASRFSTWSRIPDGRETYPMVSVSWYLAFAFCAWDGGRLPTDAEWAYAASGGSEQRTYPWGENVVDDAALWDCGEKFAGDWTMCSMLDLLPVGSRPKGRARWGHEDLLGSADEWLLDIYKTTPPRAACNDCVTTGQSFDRTSRGGDVTLPKAHATTTYSRWEEPVSTKHAKGMRCVRSK